MLTGKSKLFLSLIVTLLLAGHIDLSAQIRQPIRFYTTSFNLHLPPTSMYKSKLRADQRGIVFSYFNAFEFSYSPFYKLPGELINQHNKFGQITPTDLTSPLLRRDQLNIWLPGYQQVPFKQQLTQGLFNLTSGIYAYSRAKD